MKSAFVKIKSPGFSAGTFLPERETGLSRLRLDGPGMEMPSNKKATDVAHFIYYRVLIQASLIRPLQ